MLTLSQKLIRHSKNPEFMAKVLARATEVYGEQPWLSGPSRYIDHALRMALLLQEMDIDEVTVAAALLYGVADTSLFPAKHITVEEIKKQFGGDIAFLVQQTAELNKIYYPLRLSFKDESASSEKIQNTIKMFFAIAKDIRVILIKIASRIDGLHSLQDITQERQQWYATETLLIFVPLANRLGLGEIKRKLEDLSFQMLHPKEFQWLKDNIKERYEERHQYLEKFIPKIKKILKEEKIRFSEISFRAKSYWSTYQKLQRHQMDFEKLYDLVALRIIVNNVSSCYKVLGIVHEHFPPLSGQIQDYIAKPKENGYKSIHTTVLLEEDKVCEIQIRTKAMHQDSQYGVCAHWIYKEKLHSQREHSEFSKKIPEFFKTFTIDFYEDRIFTFTPKGDVVSLPIHATPVDFAYMIHSNLGDHCESAKINGKIIPLSQELKNGDIVEIITNPKRKPSRDWLKFVKTSIARTHIKKLTSALISPIFSVPSLIKGGFLRARDVIKKRKEPAPTPAAKKPAEVLLAGQKGMMVNWAKCCSPQPGNEVKAYLAKYRSAVLHKTSCKNFQKLSKQFPHKIVEASWHES